jgi:2,3-bisphosphoglycerate-independent phosphoglycerate mutase
LRSGRPYPLVALVVLDGWGCAPPGPGNAVELADTPVFDRLWETFPHTTLQASGEAVGLPPGQMGNSEVGHLTIGAGRVLFQDLVRVNRAIEDGSFYENQALRGAFVRARERGVNVHLLGLVSYGGVHSHIDHVRALLELARREGMGERTYIHAFTDGRDVSPTSAAKDLAELPPDRIATVCGRYYAMDRDQRWERTERALAAIMGAPDEAGRPSRFPQTPSTGPLRGRAPDEAGGTSRFPQTPSTGPLRGQAASRPGSDPVAEVRRSYDEGVTDEFIEPIVFPDRPRLTADDEAIVFNFRPDRARQLTQKLLEAGVHVTTMTRYRDDFDCPVAFEEQTVDQTLAEVLSEHGAPQLHAAETEKYAHVTYFLNGGREQAWEGETRILVPSPRDVPSYDHKPEMSAPELAERVVQAIEQDGFRFVIVNFANPDMVGHTGSIPAVTKALETVDECLRRVIDVVGQARGVALVTADHGNAEQMLEPDGTSPHTAHTSNLVPLVVTAQEIRLREGGQLADLAPTILALLDLPKPLQMKGKNLLT